MTVSEALQSINSFPIPDLFIQKVGVDRDLDVSIDYTSVISISRSYELATADVYIWLSGQPNLGEQEVSFAQQKEIKQWFLSEANRIYNKYSDPKASSDKYGFIGSKFNG